MTLRNFSNTASVATLTGPISPSDVTIAVAAGTFTNFPAAPFTATLDRNTISEEIILVTAVVSNTLTATRGYNGTAAQTHLGGATLEHTAVAVDFTEANTHINATSSVHGTSGELVGAEGSQTILDKTLVAPLLEADATMGDAVTASIPDGVTGRNLFRGMDSAGNDVFTVNGAGNVVATRLQSTGNSETDGNHKVDGGLTVAGTTVLSGAVTIPAESASTSPVRKSTTDSLNTRLTTAEGTLTAATAAATASTIAKRDASGRLAVATPSATGDAATKGYVDALDTRLDVIEAALTFYRPAGSTAAAGPLPKTFLGKVNAAFTAVSFVNASVDISAAGFTEAPYVTHTIQDSGANGGKQLTITALTATSVTFLVRAELNITETVIIHFEARGK